MFQFFLDQALSPNPHVARLFRPIKSALSRIVDAEVTYCLHGRTLVLPLSHDLPATRYLTPGFSENLRRLAGFIRRTEGELCMIDVGANVGDSWAFAGNREGDSFLLIDGSNRFFRMLERNTAGAPAVTCVCCLLSDHCEEARVEFAVARGNARVVEGGADAPVARFKTLDQLLQSYVKFRTANLLKVDVEGFDPRVLRGAQRLLREAKPAILFEHQPRQLRLAGQDDSAVFSELSALGYRRFIFYDHRGFLIGPFEVDDRERLDLLLGYARQQTGYFFDICCFHESQSAAAAAFLDEELSHSRTLIG